MNQSFGGGSSALSVTSDPQPALYSVSSKKEINNQNGVNSPESSDFNLSVDG